MPRTSSSSSRPSRPTFVAPAVRSRPVAVAPAPASIAATPVPAPAAQPTLFSSVKQGFGFGIGNSIAMNIFRSDPPPQRILVSPESKHSVPKEYTECLEMNGHQADLCKEFLTK